MKRLLRFLGLAVALACAALALGTLLPRPLFSTAEPGGTPRHILVLTNPIHTDIAVPIDDETLATFGFLLGEGLPLDVAGARYLVFGWGSRAFYLQTPTWSELKAGPLATALTLDESAMHVDVAGDIDPRHPAVQRFDVGQDGFAAMLDFMSASFQRDGRGVLRIAGAGYGANDAFFEANGRFTALAGCNTWTAAALRQAGLTTGWWNPLPVSLRWSLDLYNRSSDQPGGVHP
ncbi:TIGR02117 family protein [Aminobacter sp. HY435]|uniref:TIGR02117 family protein n=1 Tax=Aminobacter sp. HY435 TaxID=2970917 RepID=UPI0022B95973|nr:TIGR02117 family protein [Aminobacter sp. HY435]